MEATFWAKRALFNIPKVLPQGPPRIQSTRRVITKVCLSTAYEYAQRSNAAVEEEGSSEISDAPKDAVTEGMYEAKHQPVNTGEGKPQPGSTTGVAVDTAKDGVRKAVEMVENLGDTAKKTLDGAWRAAKDTAKVIKERATESDDDDDEVEKNEAIDEVKSIEELRAKAGGYDKSALNKA